MMGVTVKASSQASLRPFWECIPPVGAGLARDEALKANKKARIARAFFNRAGR